MKYFKLTDNVLGICQYLEWEGEEPPVPNRNTTTVEEISKREFELETLGKNSRLDWMSVQA